MLWAARMTATKGMNIYSALHILVSHVINLSNIIKQIKPFISSEINQAAELKKNQVPSRMVI